MAIRRRRSGGRNASSHERTCSDVCSRQAEVAANVIAPVGLRFFMFSDLGIVVPQFVPALLFIASDTTLHNATAKNDKLRRT